MPQGGKYGSYFPCTPQGEGGGISPAFTKVYIGGYKITDPLLAVSS